MIIVAYFLKFIIDISITILFPMKLVSINQFSYRCQFYIPDYPWVPALQGVITFFVLANFTLATFMDPGVIPKGNKVRLKFE